MPNLTARLWSEGALEKLTLTKHGCCYGGCPEYELTVHGNGRVVWEGHQYVEEAGRRVDTLSLAERRNLRQHFVTHDFLALDREKVKSACTSRTTSQQVNEIELAVAGVERDVPDHYGCSQPEATETSERYDCGRGPIFCRLKRIDQRIAGVVGVAKWIGDGTPDGGGDDAEKVHFDFLSEEPD
jgi:hypothetical protein